MISGPCARYPGHDPLAGLDGLVVLTHPGTWTMANPLAGQPGQPATITTGFDGGWHDGRRGI